MNPAEEPCFQGALQRPMWICRGVRDSLFDSYILSRPLSELLSQLMGEPHEMDMAP